MSEVIDPQHEDGRVLQHNKTFLATNTVSLGHGLSPLRERPPHLDSKPPYCFTRGFVVLIDWESGFSAKQFYCDFKNNGIKNQGQFIEKVLEYIECEKEFPENDLNRFPDRPDQRGEFPEVFAKGANQINYGWIPCKVTYILIANMFQFIDHDQYDHGLKQPGVFRNKKVVVDRDREIAELKTYQPNFSFFGMKSEMRNDVSMLHFDNYMLLNEDGDPLPGKPQDREEWRKVAYHYCTDFYIDVKQNKKTALIADASDKSGDTKPIEVNFIHTVLPNITIAFDPPNCNGGGGGPPGP